MLNTTGEKDEPEAIRWSEARFFNLAMKDDQLLSEKRILGDESRFTSEEVRDSRECNRMTSGLCGMKED